MKHLKTEQNMCKNYQNFLFMESIVNNVETDVSRLQRTIITFKKQNNNSRDEGMLNFPSGLVIVYL